LQKISAVTLQAASVLIEVTSHNDLKRLWRTAFDCSVPST